MARDEKKRRISATDLTAKQRSPDDAWASTRDMQRGGVSASDTARPRDRAAAEGDEQVVPGFTGTSSSGSVGGRALYGSEPEGVEEAEEG